jgi:hypothetical protein
VPDWDNTDSRERDEDAEWRDLVARFDAPPITEQPAPWPAREDVPAPPAQKPRIPQEPLGADGTRVADGSHGAPETKTNLGAPGTEGIREVPGTEGEAGGKGGGGDEGNHRGRGVRGFDDEGIRSALGPDALGPDALGPDALGGAREPDVIQAARRRRRPPPAHSVRARQAPAPPADDEHFIPPTPPPLPKLDSITKGAWAALFGGPGYLVVATAVGWSVSGIAAFCAVAAFITGFALLVLRMNEPGPGGPDDGDDGAVV